MMDLGPASPGALSTQVLFAPSAAVYVPGTVQTGIALWVGAAGTLDAIAESLGDMYIRTGDELRVDPDHPRGGFSATSLITIVGEDLVLTGAEDAATLLDTGTSSTEVFADLEALVDAAGLSDPLLTSGAVARDGLPYRGEDGSEGRALEWFYATELTSPQEHVTRGAILVDGDPEVLAAALQQGARNASGLAVAETKVDGEILRVVMEGEGTDAATTAQNVLYFYGSIPEVYGPGAPITPP